mgnify:FL=1
MAGAGTGVARDDEEASESAFWVPDAIERGGNDGAVLDWREMVCRPR